MSSSGNPDGPPEGLQDFKFTFESYLDDTSRIRPDSNPGSGDEIDTYSLAESIYKFEEENGRTYHSYRAGSYHWPNDNAEIQRLIHQHDIIKATMLGKNYFAPIKTGSGPRRILDIATGTGNWAMEMGDEFPTANVIATDLSPIQPAHVPPNVYFFVEDALQEWDYTKSFDYIHARMTLGSWPDMKENIIRQAFESLEPGGWFEAQEMHALPECDDDTMPEDFPWLQWVRELCNDAGNSQRPLLGCEQLAQWLSEAGFVDIHQRRLKVPLGNWPSDRRLKEIGKNWRDNMLSGLSGFSAALFSRSRQLTMHEIEVQLVPVRKALQDVRVHAYHRFYVVWGRKPG